MTNARNVLENISHKARKEAAMIYQKVSADMKFVDREKEVESMQGILSQKVDKVEELLQNVGKVLAKDTNYATMVSAPR